MRYGITFKKFKCRCCEKRSEYLNKSKLCDDCQYLKIRMKRNIDLTMKLLEEIKNETNKVNEKNS